MQKIYNEITKKDKDCKGCKDDEVMEKKDGKEKPDKKRGWYFLWK